jgi:class 3 adenylate cyclase
MHFELAVYPSASYKESFYTTEPQKFTIAIVLVIAFIAIIFILLDYLQSRNSGKLEREVSLKGGVIDQLFPSSVQDKLFKRTPSKKREGCTTCVTTKGKSSLPKASSRLSDYLDASLHSSIGGLCNNNAEKDVLFHDPDPIADYYENSTVLFADLVGFTSWCDNRSPTDVFKLLEGLFSAFDKKARIHHVFKVETIGDCYMAVTGVPDKDLQHAEHMADFALDILDVMNKLNAARKKQNEEVELQLRVGIASGPVTAGVVRADRARFQLFGDFVNLAARMEQNSMPGRIQLSESTYNLLVASNYDNVLTQREDKINAKGKGQLITYWLTKNTNTAHAV